MSNLFLTLVIAFVIIVIAIACMAVGWLIKGKTKIDQGSCGFDSADKRECSTTASCSIPKSQENKKTK